MTLLLNDKIEAALVALVRAEVPDLTVQVLSGKEGGSKTLPCIICTADGDGLEDPIGTGNFWMRAEVTVRYSAMDAADGAAAKTAEQTLASTVLGTLMQTGLAEALTAAAEGLTVFPGSVQFGAPETGQDEAGAWTTVLPLRLYCCGRELD